MSADSRPMPDDYSSLLAEIKERIRSAQYDALRAVNKELVAKNSNRWLEKTVGPTTFRRTSGPRGYE